MDVNAKAAVLVDPDTGEILYEKNAHAHNYPASITKVMTCLLTLEAVDRGELSLEQTVTASSALHTGHRGGRFHGRYQRGGNRSASSTCSTPP